eukprot:1747847-Amphidinium_carterae.1
MGPSCSPQPQAPGVDGSCWHSSSDAGDHKPWSTGAEAAAAAAYVQRTPVSRHPSINRSPLMNWATVCLAIKVQQIEHHQYL